MSIQRDYKPASTWQRRRQAVRRHGLLVLTLALIGLFGGALAYIRKGDSPAPASPATSATPTATAAPAPKASPSNTPTTSKSNAATAPTPAIPPLESVPPPPKPKYDFYTELPKRQINVRRDEPKPQRSAQPPTRLAPATPVATTTKANRKQKTQTPAVAVPAGDIKLVSPKKTSQPSATTTADQGNKPGSTKKNPQPSSSVATTVGGSKSATGKKDSQTPRSTSRSDSGSANSARNTTAPVTPAGPTGMKATTTKAAPIRHITTPTTGTDNGPRSAAPIRNATTPTAANSGSRPDYPAKPISPRQTRSSQSLNPSAPVAVKIE